MTYQKEKSDPLWEVPYLPIDPEDVGRSYEAIIRINSQSGKGGAAFILENEFGCSLPKDMHPEFGQVVQQKAEETGQELSAEALWTLFNDTFIKAEGPYVYNSISFDYKEAHHIDCTLSLTFNDIETTVMGTGNGPINACKNALNGIKNSFELKSYHEHSLNSGSASQAICYIQATCKTSGISKYGVGIDENISIASVKALFNALNRIS